MDDDSAAKNAAPESATVSARKVAKSVSQYVWDSPCLKTLVYNPFVLALFLVGVIWVLDFLYGKRFARGGAAAIAQHMLATYIIIAAAMAMNNIIIKHHYRLDNYAKSDGGSI